MISREKSDGRPEIIAVASGKGGTGKTLIGACLGYALIFSGHRVLMVDTDTATHGLSLFLLGPKGLNHIQRFREENTWAGTLRRAQAGELTSPVPHTIRRDVREKAGHDLEEADHGLKYQAVISALGIYGDEQSTEPSFVPSRSDFHNSLKAFLAQLRSASEYDYVIIDTRGGFSFESTDVCALADSFLVVTEADLTSFYQDRNLVRRINNVAGELNVKPLLRSILVNRATEGDEELFRVALEREFPVKFDQTHAIPLDIEAMKAYKVQQSPYVTAPGTHFSYATLKAFGEILSIVTAEWSDAHVARWNELIERVSGAIKARNLKFEQESAEEKRKGEELAALQRLSEEQRAKIEALERELRRTEEAHNREIERVERLGKTVAPVPSRSRLWWIAWLVIIGLAGSLFAVYYQLIRQREQFIGLQEQFGELPKQSTGQRSEDSNVRELAAVLSGSYQIRAGKSDLRLEIEPAFRSEKSQSMNLYVSVSGQFGHREGVVRLESDDGEVLVSYNPSAISSRSTTHKEVGLAAPCRIRLLPSRKGYSGEAWGSDTCIKSFVKSSDEWDGIWSLEIDPDQIRILGPRRKLTGKAPELVFERIPLAKE